MAVTSRLIIAVGDDGNPSVVQFDADIFGTGTLASRPASGSGDGDMYLVNDAGLGIYRLDIWDGSVWQQLSLGVATHADQDTLVHNIAENSFLQIVRSGGRVSSAVYWTDSGMTTKIRETSVTRTAGLISEIVRIQYDGAGSVLQTLTGTVTRSSGQVSSIEWVLS